jgi:hypothetical protein
MLRGVINQAAGVAGAVVASYLARAAVVVPFIVGLGFAIAALSLLLVDRFGQPNAHLMIAGVFVLLGIVSALVVNAREESEAIDPPSVGPHVAANDVSGAGAAAMPFAVLGTVLSSLGPAPFLSLLGILGRSLPLVIALGIAGTLAWPKADWPHTVASYQAGADPTGTSPRPPSKPVAPSRGSLALGTFVIGSLLAGAVLMAAFGPSTAAFPSHYVVG